MRMPKPDQALRDFFSDSENFADFINAALFSGKEVLNPNDFQVEDSKYLATAGGGNSFKKVTRARDVIRKSVLGSHFAIFGIENQSLVHYAMPIRNMLYDALEYTEQCQLLSSSFRKSDWTVDEYLSGIHKNDRLIPSFTVVFHYGERKWDGPLNLREMLEIDERFADLVPDYPVRLVDVCDPKWIKCFNSQNLKDLFQLLYNIYNNCVDERKIDGKIISLAGILTNEKKLYEAGKAGDTMACNAINEIRAEGERTGIKKGIQEGESRYSRLIVKLTAYGRSDDIVRSAENKDYRDSLYKEFGIY